MTNALKSASSSSLPSAGGQQAAGLVELVSGDCTQLFERRRELLLDASECLGEETVARADARRDVVVRDGEHVGTKPRPIPASSDVGQKASEEAVLFDTANKSSVERHGVSLSERVPAAALATHASACATGMRTMRPTRTVGMPRPSQYLTVLMLTDQRAAKPLTVA